MVKARFYKDEWWPVWTFSDEDDYGTEIEVDPLVLSAYKTAWVEFDKAHGAIAKLCWEASKRDK
jgi:hypothetical protein